MNTQRVNQKVKVIVDGIGDKRQKVFQKNKKLIKEPVSKNMPFHTQNIPLIHRGKEHRLPLPVKMLTHINNTKFL